MNVSYEATAEAVEMLICNSLRSFNVKRHKNNKLTSKLLFFNSICALIPFPLQKENSKVYSV